MRRSKLEVYVDIMQTLRSAGELKLTPLMQKSNINCSFLKLHLDYLIGNLMVEEKKLKKVTVYALTARGIRTLRAFNEIEQLFSSEKPKRVALTQNFSNFNRQNRQQL